jgi:di/tricarboxylate transporter
MTLEIAIVLIVVIAAVILFATEKLSIDLVALMVMAVLILTGIVTPGEGISGFSNVATITVGAMFIISGALYKTGVVKYVGNLVIRIFKLNFWFAILLTMIIIGVLSMFINNTPVVAIFLPIMLGVSEKVKINASKLLIPLSFASMFGGVCTLIGTSTNILVSSISEQYGLEPFSMFEFAPLGLIFFAVGLIYMLIFGIRLIPDRRIKGDLTQTFGMGEYLTEIVLLPEAKSVGIELAKSPLVKDLDVTILEIKRGSEDSFIPNAGTILRANDLLRVRCNIKKIKKLQERSGIVIKPEVYLKDEDIETEKIVLIEAIISPNSYLEGRSLRQVQFRNLYSGIAIAIRHSGRVVRENLANTKLRAGDALLIEVNRDQLFRFKESTDFVFINEIMYPTFRKNKIIPALFIVTGVVTTASLGILPIVASSIIGCVLLILIGCISLEEAYKSVEWKVIFLLAGTLTLGVALEKTGAALYISNIVLSSFGSWGPIALVAVFYLLTTVLTETMSNNATAVLLAPIAITAAESMGISARPLLVAVTFAASSSFLTPVGYQTNTLIYSAGMYKYTDFLRVGSPLNLIFWILATILIPILFPF